MEDLRTPILICLVLGIALCVFSEANELSDQADLCTTKYCGFQCEERIECVVDDTGADYRGTKSTTASGIKCQAWSSQEPHKHTRGHHTSVEENYCRNPDNGYAPWCYTTDPKKRWEYCGVPKCEKCKTGYWGPKCDRPKECVFDQTGAGYRGTTNTTVSGIQCQAWSSQTPHQHNRDRFPSVEKNYCRNPDNEPYSWCYSTDPKIRWMFCGVPRCEKCQTGYWGPKCEKPCNTGFFGPQCEHRKECVFDFKGVGYRGIKSTTASGIKCQAWSSQSPHKHTRGNYPGVEENYCRNPDNEPAPWCYTTDPNKRWDFCGIPKCE